MAGVLETKGGNTCNCTELKKPSEDKNKYGLEMEKKKSKYISGENEEIWIWIERL